MNFEKAVIEETVNKLLKGEDYRQEVVNFINVAFLDFAILFFKAIVNAKFENKEIDLIWYKKTLLNPDWHKKYGFNIEDTAIFAGINRKTITNIYGSATKEIILEVSNSNFEYLSELISSLREDLNNNVGITIKISHNGVYVELSLAESLLVINALATKKLAIRGGAWSSIGKKVEKPLIDKLCDMVKIPKIYINNSTFKRDKSKDYDREVDYKLINYTGKEYRIEVKLMGRGNPESADAVIARDSDIFIADTLSEQNKLQLTALNIEYLELKNNIDTIKCFTKILKKLGIPFGISI